ncbi:metallophosphoesterase [Mesorhizobium sp.]|uniref:metallophosphoesterase family protein n=1 Tax=Mesorhizobium sp. TaxID=1871066 RepID=UPI000FE9E187|nr:metallophosphoesterase [Mesorhizobium sp.]RWE54068.1 MAG: hypothetical protein EOS67_25550 [Mesorhizobium sp.]
MSYSILHISDLHYSKKNAEQRNFLANKFFEDLRVTIDSQGKPNAIVFSGDIVNNPDEDDVYLYAIDSFFERLFEISGLSSSALVLCPGNHDISRLALKQHLPIFHALRQGIGNNEVIEGYYQNQGLTEYATDLSRKFFEFCEYIDLKWDNPFFRISKIGDSQFLSMNSAFSCSPEGSVQDRGKLIYPPGAIEEAISKLEGGRSLGVVNHFPLTDFEEGNFRIVEPRIRSTTSFVFYGHVHSANPIAQTFADSRVIHLQSGALFSRNDYFKGYSYTAIEGEHSFSLYRSYYDQRAVFDVATNVAKDGVYYPTPASRSTTRLRQKSRQSLGHTLIGSLLVRSSFRSRVRWTSLLKLCRTGLTLNIAPRSAMRKLRGGMNAHRNSCKNLNGLKSRTF